MKKLWVKMKNMYNETKGYVNNEQGAQALEWVALGLVVITVMSVIVSGITGDASIGNAIVERLSTMISSIGG